MAADNQAVRENKLGTMPINKLLLSTSLPMMASMLVQALYNIVDSMFVARINEDALTAVSLAFSIQNFLFAFAIGTGVGVNALLSKSLGEKNQKVADKTAGNAITIFMALYVIALVLGKFVVEPFFRIQTTDPTIFQYGCDYVNVLFLCAFGMLFQVCMERLLISTGLTFYSMITQITGAVINCIVDPILIFGLFGFPRLEVKGAALATIFGQFVAGALGLYFNKKKNHFITLKLKNLKPNFKIIGRVYQVGLPSIVMASIGSFMVFGMNKILIAFTTTAVAVFGVYFKLQSFIFMPVFGLNNGMVPIVAYNYGARNKERITHTVRLAATYAVSIMAFGTLVFECFPKLLLKIFDASPTMIEIGTPALRIIAIHFMIAGVCIILNSSFQALGKAFYSMIVSISRQLIVLLPVAWLLSRTGNLDAVWFAFPIAETASLIICICFFLKCKKLIDFPEEDKQTQEPLQQGDNISFEEAVKREEELKKN